MSDVIYFVSYTPAVFFMPLDCHFPLLTFETYKTVSSCLVTFTSRPQHAQSVKCSEAIVGLCDTDK